MNNYYALDAQSYLFMISDDISTYQHLPSLKVVMSWNNLVTHEDACKIFQNIERRNKIITKGLLNRKSCLYLDNSLSSEGTLCLFFHRN